MIVSMKQMEDRFNKKYQYPYIFLNEEPFEDKFKQYETSSILFYTLWTTLRRRITELTDADVKFGLIPREQWFQPDWIDEEKATAARNEMVKNQVIYGGMSNQNCFWSVV